jgi:hypothetical protein
MGLTCPKYTASHLESALRNKTWSVTSSSPLPNLARFCFQAKALCNLSWFSAAEEVKLKYTPA